MQHLLYLLLMAQAASLVSGQFFNPTENGKSVWRLGEKQTIRMRTQFTKYTIALWQEIGNGANIGPIMYETSVGGIDHFDFIVSIDNLVLSNSDRFFLWLKAGDIDQQSNATAPSMSSSYFRITDEEPESSSSSSAMSTQTSTTTSSIEPKSTTETTTSASASSTAPANTNASPTTAPTEPLSQPSNNIENPNPPAAQQEGLVMSAGAIAGIGAAAGVCGLSAIIGVVYCIFRRKWRRRELEFQEQQRQSHEWSSGYPPPSRPQRPQPPSEVDPEWDYKAPLPRYPVEMYTHRPNSPFELFGGVPVAGAGSPPPPRSFQ